MTLDQFRAACVAHDLTYSYSDDGGVWRRGEAARRAIEEAAKQFPRAEVVRIWNETVDKKISQEGDRKSFYWKE